jgi:adenylate kinase family enzyme/DNA-binding XRE family transcriptional regulator
MPDKGPLTLLRQVREAVGLSQADMAQYFDFKGPNGRNTVARWENGEGNPPAMKHRRAFIAYLAIKVGLHNDRQRFDEVWRTLEEHWNWPRITDREWIDCLVHNNEPPSSLEVASFIPRSTADAWIDNDTAKIPTLTGIFSTPLTTVIASTKLQTEEFNHANWEEIAERYRHSLEEDYGSMQIIGMERPISLDDIFTDVYVLDKPSAWRRYAVDKSEKLPKTEDIHHTDTHREIGVSFVRKHQHVFIFGKPGAGKTTFLKYLIKEAINSRIPAIPVFISIKRWFDSNLKLESYIEQEFHRCQLPNSRLFVEALLDQGQALLLFDGLDEINLEDNARTEATRAIRDAVRQYGVKNRVAITCRTAATDYLFERLSYCEVADFTTEQIQVFAANWFRFQPKKLTEWYKAFDDPNNQSLAELSRTPLLLTLLCLIFDETQAFPLRKAELFEEALNILLTKWDSSRSIQRDTIYRALSLGRKRQMLSEIGYKTFINGNLFISKKDMLQFIEAFTRRLPPINQGEDIDYYVVLQSIEAQHGILVERARDIYSFSHLTFHEYYTARYIADRPIQDVLTDAVVHGAKTRWREVLLLTSSLLNHESSATLFDLWCRNLLETIHNSSTFVKFFLWIAKITNHKNPIDSLRTRLRVCLLVLEDKLYKFAQDLVYEIATALELTRDNARDLTGALSSNLAQADALARDFEADLESGMKLDDALDRASSLASALIDDLELALDSINASDSDRVRGLGTALNSALSTAKELDLASMSTRARAHTNARACIRVIDRIIERKTDIDRNRNLDTVPLKTSDINRWDFNDDEYIKFADYFASVRILLECLELATIEDRNAIYQRLLMLPQ